MILLKRRKPSSLMKISITFVSIVQTSSNWKEEKKFSKFSKINLITFHAHALNLNWMLTRRSWKSYIHRRQQSILIRSNWMLFITMKTKRNPGTISVFKFNLAKHIFVHVCCFNTVACSQYCCFLINLTAKNIFPPCNLNARGRDRTPFSTEFGDKQTITQTIRKKNGKNGKFPARKLLRIQNYEYEWQMKTINHTFFHYFMLLF